MDGRFLARESVERAQMSLVTSSFAVEWQSVPEPSLLGLVAIGLMGLVIRECIGRPR